MGSSTARGLKQGYLGTGEGVVASGGGGGRREGAVYEGWSGSEPGLRLEQQMADQTEREAVRSAAAAERSAARQQAQVARDAERQRREGERVRNSLAARRQREFDRGREDARRRVNES